MARQVTDPATAGIFDPPPKFGARILRWISLVPLALVVAGIASYAMGADQLYLRFFTPALAIVMVPLIFPPGRRDRILSMGERLRRMRTTLAGALAIAVIAGCAAGVFAYNAAHGYWTPATEQDWTIIQLSLLVSLLSVQAICLTWVKPALREDEE